MAIEHLTAAALRDRFIEEQEYVQQYLDLITYRTQVHEREIMDISTILHKHGLLDSELRRDPFRVGKSYSFTELQEVYNRLESILPNISATMEATRKELGAHRRPEGLNQVDARSVQGEAIEFVLNALEEQVDPRQDEPVQPVLAGLGMDATDQQREKVRRELIAWLGEYEPNALMNYDATRLSVIDMTNYAIAGALFIRAARKINELDDIVTRLRGLAIQLRMSDPEAEINIHRQAFISLLAIFDATIFDIVRIALRNGFFQVIARLGRKLEKIAAVNLKNYNSFDGFRDQLIEDVIRNFYLKELLGDLKELGVPCVDQTANDKFEHLLEMVARRNAHLHNRGRVDQKYDENNIYRLPLGAVAPIDQAYWEQANRLCYNCVSYTADWADSLR